MTKIDPKDVKSISVTVGNNITPRDVHGRLSPIERRILGGLPDASELIADAKERTNRTLPSDRLIEQRAALERLVWGPDGVPDIQQIGRGIREAMMKVPAVNLPDVFVWDEAHYVKDREPYDTITGRLPSTRPEKLHPYGGEGYPKGKTDVMRDIYENYPEGGKFVVVTHSEELIPQDADDVPNIDYALIEARLLAHNEGLYYAMLVDGHFYDLKTVNRLMPTTLDIDRMYLKAVVDEDNHTLAERERRHVADLRDRKSKRRKKGKR